MIVFVHIPKTGGTSVRNAAAEYFGEAAMLYDYGPTAPKTSTIVSELRYERDEPERLAEWIRTNDIAFISGHFKLEHYASIVPEADAVTWLRDPVRRVQSLHRHRTNHHGERASLDAFSTRYPYRNGMVDQAGTETSAYAVIGVIERHEDSLRRLDAQLGVKLVVRNDNAQGPHTEIDDALADRIRNRNREDVLLVDAAAALL